MVSDRVDTRRCENSLLARQQPEGPYGNYADNVLLPAGNYAGRVCDEGERQTLWNFFYVPSRIKGTGNMLPSPRRLGGGRQNLRLESYHGFDRTVTQKRVVKEYCPWACSATTPLHIFKKAFGRISGLVARRALRFSCCQAFFAISDCRVS